MKKLLNEYLDSIQQEQLRKPGAVWQTSTGNWAGKNPGGKREYFGTGPAAKANATRYARGETGMSPKKDIDQPKRKSATKPIARAPEESQLLQPLFGHLPSKASQAARMRSLDQFAMTVQDRIDVSLQPDADQLLRSIRVLLAEYSKHLTRPTKRSEATLRRLVESLQSKYNFYSNKSGKAFKTRQFGMGERHIFGKGSALSTDLVNVFDKFGVDLKEVEDQDKGPKRQLERASKPNLGKKIQGTERVNALFESGLSQLPEKFWQVFGPTDDSDDLLDNSRGINARIYFEHSVINNNSLENTIQVLQQQGLDSMASAIDIHRREMQAILRNWSRLKPKEREEAVQKSYAKMAVTLHDKAFGGDPELCTAIMKNLAEINLYDQEIAGGKEVYLPSHGSFPGADKIVVTRKGTKVERIDSISVKFGKKGRIYGMPAQSANLSYYHKDTFYHGLNANRVGLPGGESGVSDRVLDQKSWNRLMRESGYLKLIGKDKSDMMLRLYQELQLTIREERDRLPAGRRNLKDIARMVKTNKRIDAGRQQIQKLVKTFPLEKLSQHIGNDNIQLMTKNPMSFAAMMSMHATILSGDGLPSILHCHQEVSSKNGVPQYVMGIQAGSTTLPYWRFIWRESDERGGGLLVSYNKED
jgi:hypothetical protein